MNKYLNCKCTYCNKELGEFNFKTFATHFKGYIQNGKRRIFCDKECYNAYIKQFEVEVYNGNPIYAVEYDGEIRYMPYWFSSYYFTDIDNCKKRMELKNTAIVPTALLSLFAKGEM